MRGFADPMRGILLASLHAGSSKVKSSQIELRASQARDGGSQVPLGGLLGIRGTSAAALVKVSEVSLGEWITSICGLAIPAHGFVEVLVHA